MEIIKIQDESGDKKYFTQLPHYILNHSTAIDQALYWQMKRYAGEDGKCFATQETLIEKLGIGKKTYRKSLQYLLGKKWIKFIGTTKGKTRPIKTYSITDIWKLNILNYEKIRVERTISFQEIRVESNKDTSQKNHKIRVERTIEEEQRKEEHIKNTIAANAADEVFNFNNTLKDWIDGDNKIYSLIGKFFRYKDLTFATKDQMQIAAKRHLRAAKELQFFTEEQIEEAIQKIMRNENLKKEFTLETILKYLSK